MKLVWNILRRWDFNISIYKILKKSCNTLRNRGHSRALTLTSALCCFPLIPFTWNLFFTIWYYHLHFPGRSLWRAICSNHQSPLVSPAQKFFVALRPPSAHLWLLLSKFISALVGELCPPCPPWMKISLPRNDLLGMERWPISHRRRAKSLFLNGLLLGSICTGIQVKLINHCQAVRIKQ